MTQKEVEAAVGPTVTVGGHGQTFGLNQNQIDPEVGADPNAKSRDELGLTSSQPESVKP
jgi:hypothetical protein